MFSSRLLSFLLPLFIPDIVYLPSREIDPPFSLFRAGEAFCFLAPHRLLFCAIRHPWWPTQLQPRRNCSSNVVHLAPRPLVALNSSLFHLPWHPRVPSPTRIHDGGGRSWRWEPAHVWAPLAGRPVRYPSRLYNSTLRMHGITGVTRTDSSRPSRSVRAPAFASSASTTPSRGSRCGEQTARCRTGDLVSRERHTGDSFHIEKNRWIRKIGTNQRKKRQTWQSVIGFSALKSVRLKYI